VLVQGNNFIGIGVAAEDADARAEWAFNKRCWGMGMSDRAMRLAGVGFERSAGPEEFTLPCAVTILLDCDNGTLSVGVDGQMPTTPLCRKLPKSKPMRFAYCTGSLNSSTVVKMLTYMQLR
jgi:hypothetical protein